jgi:hypothetical protein
MFALNQKKKNGQIVWKIRYAISYQIIIENLSKSQYKVSNILKPHKIIIFAYALSPIRNEKCL